MDDQLARYQAALKQADEARTALSRVAKLIQHVGQQLSREPLKLLPENVPGDFPASLIAGRDTLHVDFRLWPSGDELAQLIALLHAALGDARKAYGEMPDELRRVVVTP